MLVHLNTHLDHRGETAMQKGAELVATRGTEIAAGHPAFFTGDFNVTPDSAPYAAVIAGGFKDCSFLAKTTDHGVTFHDFENPDYDGAVIDYVFCKGDVKVNDFRVIRSTIDGAPYVKKICWSVRSTIDGALPSDHYPVIADVEI